MNTIRNFEKDSKQKEIKIILDGTPEAKEKYGKMVRALIESKEDNSQKPTITVVSINKN